MHASRFGAIVLLLITTTASPPVVLAQTSEGSGEVVQTPEENGRAAEGEPSSNDSSEQFDAFVNAVRNYFGVPSEVRTEAVAYGRRVYLAAMSFLAHNVLATGADVATENCIDGYAIGEESVEPPATALTDCRVVAEGGISISVEMKTVEGEFIRIPQTTLAPAPEALAYSYMSQIFTAAHVYLVTEIAHSVDDVLTDDCRDGYGPGATAVEVPDKLSVASCRVIPDASSVIRIELALDSGRAFKYPRED